MTRSSGALHLARLFAALADPTRLRLLNLISGREVCVCYFVEILRMGQPKISRHLAYLRNAGLVSARRDGKWMHYSMTRPEDRAAGTILDAVLASLAEDSAMQKERLRLDRACCEPQGLVTLKGAPKPATLEEVLSGTARR